MEVSSSSASGGGRSGGPALWDFWVALLFVVSFIPAHYLFGSIVFKMGSKIVYSKHLRIELELDVSNHLLLKEDDMVSILNNDNRKDLKLLNDRVLINVAEVKEKTAGGLLLTEAIKEKPYTGKEQFF